MHIAQEAGSWLTPAVRQRTPSGSATISSPGCTSRTNSAPMLSSAQLSEAKTTLSPIRPMHSGRMPLGSRSAMSLRGLMMRSEKDPSSRGTTRATASSTEGAASRSLAIKKAMTSVSDVHWKTAPCASSSARRAAALETLPLCAMTRLPLT